MDWLKTWVTTIITLSVFIAVANAMLPNGSIKKYAKYAISILIIPNLLTPILLLIDGNNVASKIENYSAKLSLNNEAVDLSRFEGSDESTILRLFLKNLNSQCEGLLKSNYSDQNFKVETFADINKDKKIVINNVNIYIADKTLVEEIKEVSVDIDKQNTNEDSNISNKEEIKNLISTELKISPSKITIKAKKEG